MVTALVFAVAALASLFVIVEEVPTMVAALYIIAAAIFLVAIAIGVL
jgi:hypothetical protein